MRTTRKTSHNTTKPYTTRYGQLEMIYESLIAPTEKVTNLREIKKALLTYEKVKLIDPADRDVIPANSFMSVVSGMPQAFGANMGTVTPLGKTHNYDDDFQKLIDSCKIPIKEGLIEVISTYNVKETNSFTIGGIPTGGYPLNPGFVFWLFRKFSQNPDYLNAAIQKDKNLLLNIKHKEPNISLSGLGSYKINDSPDLPLIYSDNLDEDSKIFLSQIARSRIASFIKYAGFCEQKNLIPIFSSTEYGNIGYMLLNNVNKLLSKPTGDDQFWLQRNRVLRLCHEEYLDDVQLDMMSIGDILKFRTKIWGKQAKAREDLFKSIGKLSNEFIKDKIFNEKAISQIKEYRKIASELERERKNIKYQIKTDIAGGLLRGGGAGLTGGYLSQFESPFISVAATLIAGGVWALDKTKNYIPELNKLKDQEKEFNRGAGMGIQNFYSRISDIIK